MKGMRILIWVTIMFMLSGAWFTSSAQEIPGTNLVKNGSFEEGASNWSKNPSTPPERYSLDDSISTDSQYSLKLDGTTTSTSYFMSAEQKVALKPLTKYIITADIRRNTDKSKIGIAVLERPQEKMDEGWTYHWLGETPEKGLNAWEHFELKFETNSVIGVALIELYNTSSEGIAWFDNIQLMKVSGEKQ